MKRNLTGGSLALAFFISLFLTGNAFANIYTYALVKDSDKILINNIESSTIEHTIDLDLADDEDDNDTQNDGIITAMATSTYGRYLYFVTDNGDEDDGELYQVDLQGDVDDGIDKYTMTKLTSVGVRPKAVIAGLYGVYVYVANYGSNTVSVYSRSYATTESISGFNKPVSLAVTKGSDRGSDVFVANMGAKYVTMFNTYTKVDIDVTNNPTDLIATPDFEYIYVCNSDQTSANGRITVITPVDYYDVDDDGDDIEDDGENEILMEIDVTGALPTRMGMTESGDYIYTIDPVMTAGDDLTITAGAGKMTVIDSSGRKNEINTVSKTVTAGSSAQLGLATASYGTSVYTVNGIDSEVYLLDTDPDHDAASGMYADETDVFQDIIIAGDQPLWVTSLTAESDIKGEVLLEWTDNNYGATDFLIYRKDHDVEENEYKSYLLDIVSGTDDSGSDIESYYDYTVDGGDRYTYIVVPFTAVSRAIDSSTVTIKAHDSSDTEICFITSSEDSNMITGFILFTLAVFMTAFLTRKTKI